MAVGFIYLDLSKLPSGIHILRISKSKNFFILNFKLTNINFPNKSSLKPNISFSFWVHTKLFEDLSIANKKLVLLDKFPRQSAASLHQDPNPNTIIFANTDNFIQFWTVTKAQNLLAVSSTFEVQIGGR